MTNLTAVEILTGLKCCALWLTIIGVLLIITVILLAIIVYQNRKRYLELRYIADRINAIFEIKKHEKK